MTCYATQHYRQWWHEHSISHLIHDLRSDLEHTLLSHTPVAQASMYHVRCTVDVLRQSMSQSMRTLRTAIQASVKYSQ